MEEFSQMVFARVGFNSAVQGKVDIPENATKLALVLPKAEDNRNDKTLERKVLSLSEFGFGVALMDTWDEDECCNLEIVENESYFRGRLGEIYSWAKTYEGFQGGEIILVGVEKTGEILQDLNLGKTIAIGDDESIESIVEKLKKV